MRQRHSKSKVLAAALLGLLALCGATASTETEVRAESDAYRIELVESRAIVFTGVKGVTVQQHVLRVTDKASGRSLQVLFGAPEKPVSGEIRDLRIFEARLVATTHRDLAVFDLLSGRELHLTSCHDPVISGTARWVAYEAFQPRFTSLEASTNVVVVLNISSLESTTVFPQREKIFTARGTLLAWEEDPAQRTRVTKLFWGPGEESLLFFGKRWPTPEFKAHQAVDWLVMVDLRQGPEKATFVERQIAPEVYMKPGVEVTGSRILFNAGEVEWLDSNTIAIVPPDGYWWMKERITIKVPQNPKPDTRNG